TTKLVTWATVSNATGYSVSLIQNGSTIRNATVTSTQYQITESTSGIFTVSIIAKGNGTTHIDSDPRTTTAIYTKQQEPTKLVMTQPSYNDTTKLVTWATVPNAVSYYVELKRDGSTWRTAYVYSTQYEITESIPATYTVSVTARGDGTTHTDSDPRTITANYTKELPKLTMTQPSYSDTTKLVTWATVPGAINYEVTLRQGSTVIRIATVYGTQYEIRENHSGTFTVSIIAKGATTMFRDSDPKTTTANYTNEQPPNTDTYNEYAALSGAIETIMRSIQLQTLNAQQQQQTSDAMKDAFVDGFSRDQYSRHLPFSSLDIQKAFATAKYNFTISTNNYSALDRIINTGTGHTNMDLLVDTVIHETGHFFGLGEQLTELMAGKYMNYDLSVTSPHAKLDNLLYSPYYDNLLLEKVGDQQFWQTVFTSFNPTADYGVMWNNNMTVTAGGQTTTLVSFSDMQMARFISQMARGRRGNANWNRIVTEFEAFAGITNVEEEFERMGPVFANAFYTNNQTAINQIRSFFTFVRDYQAINNNLWEAPVILEYNLNAFHNPPTPGLTHPINLQQNQNANTQHNETQ
ncbi:MAG: hypothetical protein FWF98_05060, partial [Dehalococcoidia bacterium]|nr:hypothetical protein [Dehalococcoidia bacterium]